MNLQVFFESQSSSVIKLARGVVSGPGMVPFCLRMAGASFTLYGSKSAVSGSSSSVTEVVIEGEWDLEDDVMPDVTEELKAFLDARRKGSRMKKGTLKEQRVASDLLQHVCTVLSGHSDFPAVSGHLRPSTSFLFRQEQGWDAYWCVSEGEVSPRAGFIPITV